MKKILILQILMIFSYISSAQMPFPHNYQQKINLNCNEKVQSPKFLGIEKDTIDKLKSYKRYHRSFLLKSAIIPGWGQAINRQYWKIPIIYAGFGASIYSVMFANKRYKDFKQAYTYRNDQDSSTMDKYHPDVRNNFPKYTNDQIKSARDFYRRNRDLSIIITVAIYGLNIIDAYVYSYLREFDISDKLSFKIKNINLQNIQGKYYFNAGIDLKLK